MPALTQDSLRRAIAPSLAVAIVALIAAIGGYLSAGGPGERAVVPPAIESRFVAGVVSSASGDKLTLNVEGSALELRLRSTAPVEVLVPTTLDRLSSGDWVNGGAVAHAQTLLALVGIVVIPPAQLESPR